jgi:hypothetical protein
LREVVENLDHLVNILVLTDDDVEAQNRVTLSSLIPADEHGPVPRVILNHRNRSARTVANREFLVRRSVEILRAAGATKVLRIGWPPFVLHSHSTMRMGTRPENSVVDGNGESRAVRRLFIADNSALANSLGGPNPTLTMQALATRTAEKIFGMYFDGDPWVGREAPVSSVDDAVTDAVLGRRAPTAELAVTGGDSAPSGAAAAVAVGAAAAARCMAREAYAPRR